jgi:hypothetical protein
MQTREEYRRELDLELNRYYDTQESLFTVAGFKTTVPKRGRTVKNRPFLHFEWFIGYQMRGRSASQIAGKYTLQGIGEDAVHSAVADLAKILDVPLRGRLKDAEKQVKKKRLKS